MSDILIYETEDRQVEVWLGQNVRELEQARKAEHLKPVVYQPLESYHAKHGVGWNCPARWKSLLSIGSSPQPEYRYNEKAGNP